MYWSLEDQFGYGVATAPAAMSQTAPSLNSVDHTAPEIGPVPTGQFAIAGWFVGIAITLLAARILIEMGARVD